jgi:hypothetical protein
MPSKVPLIGKSKNRNKAINKATVLNTTSQRNDQARCLAYLLSIIKIFLQAALLTVDQD